MRKTLRKLKRLNAYLHDFTVDDHPEAICNYVTSQEDAAPRLSTRTGIQVLVARPEMRMSFDDSDSPADCTMDAAFFVLEKDLGNAKTDSTECAQYDRTLDVVDAIIGQLLSDTDNCDRLSGIDVADIEVRPEVKVFSSWNGYSLAVSFR